MANYGVATTHGRANNEGIGNHRADKEAVIELEPAVKGFVAL